MAPQRDPKVTERIELNNKGTAFAGKSSHGIVRHLPEEYEVLSDNTSPEGERIIRLKIKSRLEFDRKLQAIIDTIAKQLKDESKIFKLILRDALREYWNEGIDDFYDRIVKHREPVKAKEGCFKLIIGDGRKGTSCEIMLRN